MVTQAQLLHRDTRGAVMIEGLLVFPVLLLALAAVIEFGALVYRANQWGKALEIGARLASVSTPLLTDTAALTADYPIAEGGPVPLATPSAACGRGGPACDPVRLLRLVAGQDGLCAAETAGETPRGICDFARNFPADQLRITYTRTGQGIVQHSHLPALSIRLDIPPLQWPLPFLSKLLPQGSLAISIHPVTVMSEDLETCPNGCP